MALEPLFLRFGPLASQYWGSAAPSASTDKGPYAVGDVVWNTVPTANAGGAFAWICTTAGATGATAVFTPVFLGGISAVSAETAAFNTSTSTVDFTATAAQISGGTSTTDLALTGTLGAGKAITLPLVTDLVAAIPAAQVGQSYRLRIINESSANFAWTVTTNTGWTLTGTMTIAQNTWREFVVTLVSLTTATLQSVAVGTYS
jgi:hypothetical protein